MLKWNHIKGSDTMNFNIKQKLFYLGRYLLIMIIGDAVKVLGIPSIYHLPLLVFIFYNFLAISFGIKNPLEKRRDIKHKDLLLPFLFISSAFYFYIIYTLDLAWYLFFIFMLVNILEFILLKPKHEMLEKKMQKNIQYYFKNHKKADHY